jgi:hypothetical protein
MHDLSGDEMRLETRLMAMFQATAALSLFNCYLGTSTISLFAPMLTINLNNHNNREIVAITISMKHVMVCVVDGGEGRMLKIM